MKSLKTSEIKENKNNNDFEKDKIEKHLTNNQLLVVSYITEENINRCWLYFSNVLKCEGPQNIVKDYTLIKGNNTFKIGNEFSCYWIGISKIYYKVIESKNSYGIRIIGWLIDVDIGFSIRKKYIIYPITNDNKALIKLNLELIGSESHEPINFEETRDYYYKLQYTIINRIIKVMQSSIDYQFIQESFIVKKNNIICWNNIVNLHNLCKAFFKEIENKFTCNGDPEKVGTFWRCDLINKQKSVFFKVKYCSKPKKRNTWKYCIETFGTNLDIIRQELEISLTKINENNTQISFLKIFKEKINKNTYDLERKQMNKILQKMKIYLNNEIN